MSDITDSVDFSKMSDEELIAYYEEMSDLATMYDLYQLAMKILINSLYGALAEAGFRYFDVNLAEAITTTGQCMIRYIGRCTNGFLNGKLDTDEDYVYMTDTDSQYIDLEQWVMFITQGKTFPRNNIIDAIDAFSKKELLPFMAESYEEISRFTNAVYNKMQMKREAITTSSIARAKKNYIMFDIDEEGVRYAEPKLKMMGVETAKAATPKFVKESLEAGYRILLEGTEDEFIEHVAEVKKKFYQLHYNDIAFYTGVNGIDEWYDPKVKGLNKWKKGAPAHVKACITHNELLKEYGIKHIPPIKSGNKVAIVALREPNHAFNDRIAYVDNIPEEFGLVEYVDYEKLYEKLYLNPINSFASLIDYKLEKKLSIDSLFG